MASKLDPVVDDAQLAELRSEKLLKILVTLQTGSGIIEKKLSALFVND